MKPTVADVLQTLRARGERMAVVTSSSTDHARDSLGRAGLLDHFELIKGGYAVSANKPHPAPYLEAAADLGVAADTCFAFEDSDFGITSAMGAGCMAVQIPDLRPAHVPLPDLGQKTATDLADALRVLSQL